MPIALQGLALGAECGWGVGKVLEGVTAPWPHGLRSPGLAHAAFGTPNPQHTGQTSSQLSPQQDRLCRKTPGSAHGTGSGVPARSAC